MLRSDGRSHRRWRSSLGDARAARAASFGSGYRAAAETIIIPEVLDELGYTPRQGDAITVVRSAVSHEPGYLIRVARFACLGFQATDFRIHAHDLPEGVGIDGLIGLNFLKHFDYQIRSLQGRILVERAAA
jgi:hypothetical protein